jgi:hypothetical protein
VCVRARVWGGATQVDVTLVQSYIRAFQANYPESLHRILIFPTYRVSGCWATRTVPCRCNAFAAPWKVGWVYCVPWKKTPPPSMPNAGTMGDDAVVACSHVSIITLPGPHGP